MKICPACQRRYPDNTLHCPEDGASVQPMVAAAADDQGLVGRRIFGEYTFTKKLGEGGMGSVYLAQQDLIDQKVAVKVLHGRAASNDELLLRFVREAKAISLLTHPNIIRVFIFGRTEEGLVYLAMEYVQGKSMRDVLAQGPLDELRAIKIAKQTLSAMAEAHDMGIIHRDLKPDNILLTAYRGEDDYVKVLDFGIAKVKEPDGVPEQKLTQAGVVYGTPEYLSPEQAQAVELDARTDIYSMGVILYEMLTGRVPFSAPSAVTILTMHVFEEPESPRQVTNGLVAKEMEAIILKAMSKSPNDRFQSAMEFFEALSAREWQLVQQGGLARPIHIPGGELYRGAQHAPSAPPPMEGAPTAAIASPLRGSMEAPQVPATPPPATSMFRKVLIGLIALALLVLVILAVVIAVLLYLNYR